MKNPYFHALLADPQPYSINQAKPETIIELAYTWFGRPTWAYSASANKYWVGGVVAGRQYVIEYNIATGKYTPTPTGTGYENDDHNQAQLLIRSSDSRILAVYSGHNSDEIGVRISTNPLDSKSWGSENKILTGTQNSYPSPYQAGNGNIFIFYRARTGLKTQWDYIKSIDGGLTFGTPVTLHNNPALDKTLYLISSQNGDVVHFCSTPGHPREHPGAGTYHFSFNIATETAYNSSGTAITTPVSVSNMTLVQSATNVNSWILDITTKAGVPRILFAYFPVPTGYFRGKERYLRYANWNGTAWEVEQLAKLQDGWIGDETSSNLEKFYTGVARFNSANPDIIFIPYKHNQRFGDALELWKYDLRNKSIKQLTFNSKNDNWRPISIPCNQNNLLWMYNLDYTNFTDYRIQLKAMTVNTD